MIFRSVLPFSYLPKCLMLSLCGLFVSCGGGDPDTPADGASALESAEVVEKPQQDWPLFRGDAEMQGVSPVEDLTAPLELAWQFEPPAEKKAEPAKKTPTSEKAAADEDPKETAAEAESKPAAPRRIPPIKATAVVADGRVFVGSEESRFFCIDLNDGSLIWEFKAEAPITAPAAVVGSKVYVGDYAGILYALNVETGAEQWRFETEDKIEGGVNALEFTEADGSKEMRLFIGSHDYFLYCINAGTGAEIWKTETDNYIVGTPTIVASLPAVLFGGCDGYLHIVSAVNGEKLMQAEIGQYIANSAAARDGVAYVSHYGGEVLAVDVASGETVWKVTTGVEYQASPAVNDKLVLIGGRDKKLVAYDRVSGAVEWEFAGRRDFDSSPLICESGTFVGGMDGRL